jgi:hypothetical protein
MLHVNNELPDGVTEHNFLSNLVDEELYTGLLYEEHSCGKKIDDDFNIGCECEHQEFSWSTCDGCSSTLGGHRFAITGRYKYAK